METRRSVLRPCCDEVASQVFPKSWKSMFCISSETRFRESRRKLILELFSTFWTYQDAMNMNFRPIVKSDGGMRIGTGSGGVGPHGWGPLGAQRDPMGRDPREREPWGAQGIPWEGVPDPPWEGNPFEPKSPMRGDPWGPHWEPKLSN